MKEKERVTVIAAHGRLAEGLASALDIIVGADPRRIVMNCYVSPEFTIDEAVSGLMESIDFERQELVVFTDLLGGSVNNGFLKAMKDHSFTLVTNTNLATLIDYYLSHPDREQLCARMSGEELKPTCCNQLLEQMENGEPDDL
jgi:fructoselysine and glucoselysine-specific PTS system IIA component